MTDRPDKYFPYRYGEALWQYVGDRWGDEAIGEILNAAPNVGIERAFKRELGLSLEDLSDEWREAMQAKHLPQIATLERARKFSQPLLTRAHAAAAALPRAGALAATASTSRSCRTAACCAARCSSTSGSATARPGKRIKRLVKSTTDPNFEELRLLYSQSAFSPDGKSLAFTAQREGRDVLYLLDVKRRKTTFRFELPLEGVTSPSWSPDGRQLVFSGNKGGITDLYVVDRDGRNLRRLTNDRYGDLQPQWSPDGRTIAFATTAGRRPTSTISSSAAGRCRCTTWKRARLRSARPGGAEPEPQWAPDGKSIAFVSDRTGIANIFLYDLEKKEHYQLTNVVGAVLAVTEYSPAITWARQADRSRSRTTRTATTPSGR